MNLLRGFVQYVQRREEAEFIPQLRHVSTVKPSVEIRHCFLLVRTSAVGRCPDRSDLVLDSTLVPNMISRTHAIIEREMATVPTEEINRPARERPKDHWVIHDKSMNGVFINHVRVEKHRLVHGDIVVFGGGGERSVTPLGGRLEQPTSEFIFRFETVREPGINDMFQHVKPRLKDEVSPGNEVVPATQALLVGDDDSTQDFESSGSDNIATLGFEDAKLLAGSADAVPTQLFEDIKDSDSVATQDFPDAPCFLVKTPSLTSRVKTVPSVQPSESETVPADSPPVTTSKKRDTRASKKRDMGQGKMEPETPAAQESKENSGQDDRSGSRRVRKRQGGERTQEPLTRTSSTAGAQDDRVRVRKRKATTGQKTDSP